MMKFFVSVQGRAMIASLGWHIALFSIMRVYDVALVPRRGGVDRSIAPIVILPQQMVNNNRENKSKKTSAALAKEALALPKTMQATDDVRLRSKSTKVDSLSTTPVVVPAESPPAIDVRGIYHVDGNQTKKTGVTLELRGWKWDVMPIAKDTTAECGKIVFEIQVNANGELVSIQVVEKTVTPIIVQLYQRALEDLTFSRLYTDRAYPERSIGRVTFMLVAT